MSRLKLIKTGSALLVFVLNHDIFCFSSKKNWKSMRERGEKHNTRKKRTAPSAQNGLIFICSISFNRRIGNTKWGESMSKNARKITTKGPAHLLHKVSPKFNNCKMIRTHKISHVHRTGPIFYKFATLRATKKKKKKPLHKCDVSILHGRPIKITTQEINRVWKDGFSCFTLFHLYPVNKRRCSRTTKHY